MKRYYLVPFLLIIVNIAYSQGDTSRLWKRELQTSANFNQSAFSPNWQGGGVNSVSLNTLINGKLYYENDKISYTNDLQLLYGLMKLGRNAFRKNQDKIFYDTKFGYKLSKNWSAFSSLNFLTQFAPGYEYVTDSIGVEGKLKTSNFLAPGYITSSVGLQYQPKEYFWLRFGAGTIRQTIVRDKEIRKFVPENYGVDTNKIVRHEIAFQLVANFEKDIKKNLNLKFRYAAFANYENLASIDHRLDLSIVAKITKYIQVSFTGIVIYDDDIDYEVQYSNGLSVGLLYSFSDFKK